MSGQLGWSDAAGRLCAYANVRRINGPSLGATSDLTWPIGDCDGRPADGFSANLTDERERLPLRLVGRLAQRTAGRTLRETREKRAPAEAEKNSFRPDSPRGGN